MTDAPATEQASGDTPAAAGDAPAPAMELVAILADDLIWSTRLADAVRAAGARPTVLRRLEALEAITPVAVIVDLTARAYDGIAAIRFASGTGARVIAVGQHDDVALRKAATDAGASRVFTYRALFEDGPRLLGRWLAG